MRTSKEGSENTKESGLFLGPAVLAFRGKKMWARESETVRVRKREREREGKASEREREIERRGRA